MNPLVGIVMGSDSDMPVMEKAGAVLDRFDVPFEIEVMSAHRKPTRVAEYATGAAERGLGVLIAGAGLAAHLPGVVAAHTTLPVIGVPLYQEALAGADALYSCVQMPPGVPVATVGIGNAKNAAVLAVQILA
ncbi:MAG: 5-(carboxyamino)imidazole ribonucleotide mutase, partial [Actinomycetota bacterium]